MNNQNLTKPRLEISKFPDRRWKFLVRFFSSSNFWIHDLKEATWVPSLEEVADIKEILDVVNERNDLRKTLGKNTLLDSGYLRR